MALNIFGKSKWATKITSLLKEDEYAQYDSSDYVTAPAINDWIIAEEDGKDRENIFTSYLSSEKFATLFKGADDLEGVYVGEGLVVGPGSLIRPGAFLGSHIYIGANCVIDIDCTIGDYVTINDGVIIKEGAVIEDYATIESGSVIS